MNSDKLQAAQRLVADARRIVAFTGAGISAESGIPTFRDRGGLWTRVPVEEFGNVYGLRQLLHRDPARLARHLSEIGRVLTAAEPNPAHRVLAALERHGRIRGVVTQNVDDLHERAGTRAPIKIHGDILTWQALDSDERRRLAHPELKMLVANLARVRTLADLLMAAPKTAAGDFLRPAVVLFGEALPAEELAKAEAAIADADLVWVIGTSGLVEPAAGLARAAAARGVPLLETNLEPSAFSPLATVSLYGRAGVLLPQVAAPILG